MGTRARVGIQNPDGTIRSMYVSSDGYTKYLGKMLFENYTNIYRINDLIDLKAVEGVHKFFYTMKLIDWNINVPLESLTDRDKPMLIAKDIEEYLKYNFFEDYLYVFIDGEWFYSHYSNSEIITKITKKLLKDKSIE